MEVAPGIKTSLSTYFLNEIYHLNMIITYKISSWDFLSEYPLKMAYDLKNIGGWNGWSQVFIGEIEIISVSLSSSGDYSIFRAPVGSTSPSKIVLACHIIVILLQAWRQS